MALENLNPKQYHDPLGGVESSVGAQLRTEWYIKQALIEARKTQFFSQLADVTAMPKHYGKKIVRYRWIPLLDDANINDQGIDAAGQVISAAKYYATLPGTVFSYSVEADATAATTAINAVQAGLAVKSGTGPWTVTVTTAKLPGGTQAQALEIKRTVPGSTVQQGSGNLYGSSKDVGTIPAKLPTVGENGGRVNRVGFKRVTLEGTFEKFGIFHEWTEESINFDTEEELEQHVNRELLNGAHEMTEDMLQIDLLNSAGVIRYAGNAISNRTLGKDDLVTYSDLMKLSITLTDNRTPSNIKMITGTRMIDTKTVQGARPLYIGSELIPTLRAMKDLHDNPAFVSIEKYAAGGNTLIGEIGQIDQFRIILVPEMMKWEGGGAPVEAGDGSHYDNGTNYDIFPMLCVGDESFTTIGFQTDGKTTKFVIRSKKPGNEVATFHDPYGETGFMSIKWYYGFMVLRPERIGLIKTVARL